MDGGWGVKNLVHSHANLCDAHENVGDEYLKP